VDLEEREEEGGVRTARGRCLECRRALRIGDAEDDGEEVVGVRRRKRAE
jgi:hypothetical protein